jgi:hypothetical protein
MVFVFSAFNVPTTVAAATYYSPKQLGISVLNVTNVETSIEKANSKKIYYYDDIVIGEEGNTVSQGKLKSAKITSKTKFYYGNTERLFKNVGSSGKTYDTYKWIKKISKSSFLKKMKNYNGTLDKIVVKNGNVFICNRTIPNIVVAFPVS